MTKIRELDVFFSDQGFYVRRDFIAQKPKAFTQGSRTLQDAFRTASQLGDSIVFGPVYSDVTGIACWISAPGLDSGEGILGRDSLVEASNEQPPDSKRAYDILDMTENQFFTLDRKNYGIGKHSLYLRGISVISYGFQSKYGKGFIEESNHRFKTYYRQTIDIHCYGYTPDFDNLTVFGLEQALNQTLLFYQR